MTEKIYTHHRHEQDKSNHELEDHDAERLDGLISEKAHDARHEHAEKIDDIRENTQEAAKSSAEVMAQHLRQEREQEPEATGTVREDLRSLKYKRTLQSVQKRESIPERMLSRVMHNTAVDTLSTVAEKTVARPSGLLVGGVFAFLGSSTFLYIAKHYGYEYNFLLFALFFAGGFAVGLVLELVYRVIKRQKT
jgi:hypothetical protein